MFKDISPTLLLVVSVFVGTIILIYHTYQIWFFPKKYTNNLKDAVQDWWPFSNFYRKWFASMAFLWLFRLVYTITLVALILLLVAMILGMIGLIP